MVLVREGTMRVVAGGCWIAEAPRVCNGSVRQKWTAVELGQSIVYADGRYYVEGESFASFEGAALRAVRQSPAER